MRIGSSTSLFTQNALERTSRAISRSLERLSTGMRVNSPKDDVAAYSLGVNLDTQIRGYSQATRNINDAQGLVQTASDAISTQIEIVQKMRELAVQASNGSLSTIDRAGITTALLALNSEFSRISSTTQFNGIHLLDGSFQTQTLQIGSNSSDTLALQLPSTQSSAVFQKTIGSGKFQSVQQYSTKDNPAGVIAGDFNNDGKMDIVTSNIGAGTISVMLGNGDGTLQFRASYTAGAGARPPATTDFNGDGILDIVTADYSDNTLSILMGNGDGTFKPRTTLAASGPLEVSFGDINKDGKMDIISGDGLASTVTFYLGNGDGSFGIRKTIAGGVAVSSVKAVDVNSDGNLDILETDNGDQTFSISLGNGDGTFRARTTMATGTGASVNPVRIKIADLNRDGILDVLVADGNSSGSTLSQFLGNGDGTFKARTALTVGTNPNDMEIADLNGDGVMDIASLDNVSATISVLIGNGDGTYQARFTLAAGTNAQNIVAVDLNKDGVPDLIDSAYNAVQLNVYLSQTTSVTAVSNFNLNSASGAQKLISILDQSLALLTADQSNLGAIHNRLEQSVALNQSLVANFSEARDKATQVDLAQETAELVRNQILQQAQVAALTQGNLNMQTVLKLLDTLK